MFMLPMNVNVMSMADLSSETQAQKQGFALSKQWHSMPLIHLSCIYDSDMTRACQLT